MRILQHIEWSFQESLGGVEVYSLALGHALRARGIESVFVAPAQCDAPGETTYEGFRIFNFPRRGQGERIAEWRTPGAEFAAFGEWLRREHFDVYHLHAWNAQANSHHVALARSLGIPVVLTCHLPGGTCSRGTLLEHAVEPCDGRFESGRCTACLGYGLSLPPLVRRVIAATPPPIAEFFSEKIAPRFLHEKLGRYSLVNLRFRMFADAFAMADRVIAVCDWHKDVLVRNGFPAEKIRVSRLGISTTPPAGLPAPKGGDVLEVLFLGRIRPDKGLGVLVDAIKELSPEIPVRLSIYGRANGTYEENFLAGIEETARVDSRVRYCGMLDRAGVWQALASTDVLAVPSQVPETGPLVVLEAHAVGTPVVGSHFGGIAESVRDGIDGWLVPYPDLTTASAWASVLARLAGDLSEVRAARRRMRPARTMDHVAEEMHQQYLESAGATPRASEGFVHRVFRKVFRAGGIASAGILASDQFDLLQLLISA